MADVIDALIDTLNTPNPDLGHGVQKQMVDIWEADSCKQLCEPAQPLHDFISYFCLGPWG